MAEQHFKPPITKIWIAVKSVTTYKNVKAQILLNSAKLHKKVNKMYLTLAVTTEPTSGTMVCWSSRRTCISGSSKQKQWN